MRGSILTKIQIPWHVLLPSPSVSMANILLQDNSSQVEGFFVSFLATLAWHSESAQFLCSSDSDYFTSDSLVFLSGAEHLEHLKGLCTGVYVSASKISSNSFTFHHSNHCIEACPPHPPPIQHKSCSEDKLLSFKLAEEETRPLIVLSIVLQ